MFKTVTRSFRSYADATCSNFLPRSTPNMIIIREALSQDLHSRLGYSDQRPLLNILKETNAKIDKFAPEYAISGLVWSLDFFLGQFNNRHGSQNLKSIVEGSRIDAMIKTSFKGGFAQLQSMLINHATSFLGGGWTWLLVDLSKRGLDGTPKLIITNTFDCDVPLFENQQRNDTTSNDNAFSVISTKTTSLLDLLGKSLSHSPASTIFANDDTYAIRFLPLFCINLWEHAWIADFLPKIDLNRHSFKKAKELYVNECLKNLNWDRIESIWP